MKRKNQRGFTLIEVLIVVSILGVLAAMVVPRVMDRPDQARIVAAKSDIQSVVSALKLYRLDNGFYPTTEQGLKALVEQPSTNPVPRLWNPDGYLEKVPLDPWQRDYLYENRKPGGVEVRSLGADGEPDGEGFDADISSKDLVR